MVPWSEWLGNGLQNHVQRFDSARYLQQKPAPSGFLSYIAPSGLRPRRAHYGAKLTGEAIVQRINAAPSKGRSMACPLFRVACRCGRHRIFTRRQTLYFVVAGRFQQLRGRAIVGACGSGPIAQEGARGWWDKRCNIFIDWMIKRLITRVDYLGVVKRRPADALSSGAPFLFYTAKLR